MNDCTDLRCYTIFLRTSHSLVPFFPIASRDPYLVMYALRTWLHFIDVLVWGFLSNNVFKKAQQGESPLLRGNTRGNKGRSRGNDFAPKFASSLGGCSPYMIRYRDGGWRMEDGDSATHGTCQLNFQLLATESPQSSAKSQERRLLAIRSTRTRDKPLRCSPSSRRDAAIRRAARV